MSLKLKLSLILFALMLLLMVFNLLKKEKLSVKYSLPWFLISVIVIVVALFPNVLVLIQRLLGFVSMANLVIGILLSLLVLLTLILTIIISGQKKDITLLIQEVSFLKSNSNKKD